MSHLDYFTALLLVGCLSSTLNAATIRVPEDQLTIQAGIQAAKSGDTVLVAAGIYHERIQLKDSITLRSAGDDDKGQIGLKRAERTVIDGGGKVGDGPGVTMAEGAILNGFTVTNVGVYDDAEWQKHHATQGSHQPHEHIGTPGQGGVAARGVSCVIEHNIVHHIGYTGIALEGASDKRGLSRVRFNFCYRNMGGGIGSMRGATAVIERNECFQNFYAGIGHDNASPLVLNNRCYENIRAGIGVSEGAKPIVRGNQCYRNRRAGIGIRTGAETSPLVEENDCHHNDMAGIGCEERCAPILRNNNCHENAMAGIGCRDNARPTIVGNHVHHNQAAGIGFDSCEDGHADVLNNRVLDNDKVAVGIHAGWYVRLVGNELVGKAGLPPVVMVFKGADADFVGNTLKGSGVAGLRVEGIVRATGNAIECMLPRTAGGPPQFGVWGLPGAEVMLHDNKITGWRQAISAEKSKLTDSDNHIVKPASR